MEQFADWLYKEFDFQGRTIIRGLVLVAVICIAYLSDFIVKKSVLRAIKLIIDKSKNQWDNALVKHKFFTRLSHIAPAMVIYGLAPFVFAGYQPGIEKMRIASYLYMAMIGLFVVDAFLNALVDIYRTFSFSKSLPIKGAVQVVKIVLYLLTFVIILSVLLKKNPATLLTGMGAMTAVLLLIFKDSILGFVAGIQLITNKMIRIGDWIEMPKYGADGDVIDITLMTVKVQNWDKTICTIPAYALVSDSFKNWRGMSESGGRRIKRAVYIDINSIKLCNDQMLEKFRNIHYISDYINEKEKELAEFNEANGIDNSIPVNGRRLTNIGTFRAYVVGYLRNHPKIHKNMTFLVRHLEPCSKGLGIQIYVFSNDQVWANYEAIQADIFDHILAVIPEFELRVFQEPAGADFNSDFFIRNA